MVKHKSIPVNIEIESVGFSVSYLKLVYVLTNPNSNSGIAIIEIIRRVMYVVLFSLIIVLDCLITCFSSHFSLLSL